MVMVMMMMMMMMIWWTFDYPNYLTKLDKETDFPTNLGSEA